ncbi:hypothetical protein ONZ45_g16105 [Pleurotus djamor]|nr:hypothetical protein ONZ45_g16105 [Pleurotus djamor]
MSIDVSTLIALGRDNSVETTIRDHEVTISEWIHSNPSLGLSLLSDDEVNVLAPIAQKETTYIPEAESDTKFLQWAQIAVFSPIVGAHILGILLVARIAWTSHDFMLKTFISLGEVAMPGEPRPTVWVKGPSLHGKINVINHVGPIQVHLPYVGLINLWAGETSGCFFVTVEVSRFMGSGPSKKRFLLAQRPPKSSSLAE